MDEASLALRSEILASFAATGAPPAVEPSRLKPLVDAHVVVLGDDGASIRMAHPFAAHREGARVESGGRTWWGNCAWDGLGIVAALGLAEASVVANGLTVRVRDGAVQGDAVFHVAVPARRWWDDIAYT